MEEGTCPATPLHCICAPSLCSISLPCFAQYFFALLCIVSIYLTLFHLVQYFFVLVCFFILSFVPLCSISLPALHSIYLPYPDPPCAILLCAGLLLYTKLCASLPLCNTPVLCATLALSHRIAILFLTLTPLSSIFCSCLSFLCVWPCVCAFGGMSVCVCLYMGV